MRKDVKLGMAIGGGLIVLLVGYLLFSPPANSNKKGTQLADGRSMPNIAESAGPGDLITGGGQDDKSAKSSGEGNGTTRGNGPETRPSDTHPKQGEGTAKPEDHSKPAGDPWSDPLKKGTTARKGGSSSETEHAKPGKHDGEGHAKSEIEARSGHESGEGRGTPGPVDPPKFIYNPNDAWGGGVSTDAVFGNSHSGKTDLAAGGARTTSGSRNGGGSAHGTDGSGGSESGASGAAGGTHIVKAGETLSSIALSAYGSSAYYPHILRANPGINPNNLKLGTPLKLPPLKEVKADAPAADHAADHPGENSGALEARIDPSKQYRVQAGDSLYKISMKVYGKSTYIDRIYEKNKALIGADNKRLKLGMVLDLPEKAPTVAAAPSDETNSSLSDQGSLSEENQAK